MVGESGFHARVPRCHLCRSIHQLNDACFHLPHPATVYMYRHQVYSTGRHHQKVTHNTARFIRNSVRSQQKRESAHGNMIAISVRVVNLGRAGKSRNTFGRLVDKVVSSYNTQWYHWFAHAGLPGWFWWAVSWHSFPFISQVCLYALLAHWWSCYPCRVKLVKLVKV